MLAGPERKAIVPGQLDWRETGIEQGKTISSEPFGRLQSLAAILSSPATGALTDVASPTLSALTAVLAGVRHTELPSLWTPCQSSVVEDVVIEVHKFPVNFKVPDAPIERFAFHILSPGKCAELEGSCEVKEGVAGVEEGAALLSW